MHAVPESTKQVEEGITPAGRKRSPMHWEWPAANTVGESTPVRLPERKPLSVNELLEFIDHSLQLAAIASVPVNGQTGCFMPANLVRFHGK